MNTKKILIYATSIIVGAMLFSGLYDPNSPLMWLASSTNEYAYMRVALIAVLVSLLITNPARSRYFRTFLASFAAALFASTLFLVNAFTIELVDAIIFIEVAIIFMIEAIEPDATPVRASAGLKIKPHAVK